jgi:monoamine oxidase
VTTDSVGSLELEAFTVNRLPGAEEYALTREKHDDGRIVLAGEHASRLGGWQEGALLSSLDAIRRVHQRVLAA